MVVVTKMAKPLSLWCPFLLVFCIQQRVCGQERRDNKSFRWDVMSLYVHHGVPVITCTQRLPCRVGNTTSRTQDALKGRNSCSTYWFSWVGEWVLTCSIGPTELCDIYYSVRFLLTGHTVGGVVHPRNKVDYQSNNTTTSSDITRTLQRKLWTWRRGWNTISFSL